MSFTKEAWQQDKDNELDEKCHELEPVTDCNDLDSYSDYPPGGMIEPYDVYK